jgi:hypothetical protein
MRILASLIPTALQFDGDPNLETEPGTIDQPGRFNQDLAYDIASGTFFYWDNSVPEWVPVQIEDLHGEIEATRTAPID